MIREIVLDTETTGMNPTTGDRIVEIGCIELLNHVPTGESFHAYMNPQIPMPEGAFRVHGLSDEFLSDKPLFEDIVDDFLNFIGDSTLVIHNASFDIAFLNAELARCNRDVLAFDRALDTLALARKKHPGAQNNLDALCSRYHIDNSKRTKHGALLDSEILAEVYLELIGGKQRGFDLAPSTGSSDLSNTSIITENNSFSMKRKYQSLLTDQERQEHLKFIAGLGEKAIWKKYIREEDV